MDQPGPAKRPQLCGVRHRGPEEDVVQGEEDKAYLQAHLGNHLQDQGICWEKRRTCKRVPELRQLGQSRGTSRQVWVLKSLE